MAGRRCRGTRGRHGVSRCLTSRRTKSARASFRRQRPVDVGLIFFRPLARRAATRVCGQYRQPVATMAAAARSNNRRATGGHRGRELSVLVTGQPRVRILCRWQAQTVRSRRRVAAGIGRRAEWQGRDVELGWDHPVCAGVNRCAVPDRRLWRRGDFDYQAGSSTTQPSFSVFLAGWSPIPVFRGNRAVRDGGRLPRLTRRR